MQDNTAYQRFGIWTAVITLIYVVYGAMAAARRSDCLSLLPHKAGPTLTSEDSVPSNGISDSIGGTAVGASKILNAKAGTASAPMGQSKDVEDCF